MLLRRALPRPRLAVLSPSSYRQLGRRHYSTEEEDYERELAEAMERVNKLKEMKAKAQRHKASAQVQATPEATTKDAADMASAAERMQAKMREMARAEAAAEDEADVHEDEAKSPTANPDEIQDYIKNAFAEAGFTDSDFAPQSKVEGINKALGKAETKARAAVPPKQPAALVEAAVHPATPSEMDLLAYKLPIPAEALPPNPTEAEVTASLQHGRSFHVAPRHPPTSFNPAAVIHLRSYHLPLLSLFTHFIEHSAFALGIPLSGVASLPKKRSLWTVIKGPFVHKKSQENFERIEYKRAVKAWDADSEVVDRWVKYLERHNMGGVGMRIVRWDRQPLGYQTVAGHHESDIEKMSRDIVKEETREPSIEQPQI